MTTPKAASVTDPLEALPGYLLRRAALAAVNELNEQLTPLGLRHADVALLMLVDALPKLTQSEAGRLLDVQRANMVAFVGRLQRRGLIARERVDGRSFALVLTPAGKRQLAAAQQTVKTYEHALLQRVPKALRPMVMPILLALWKGE